MDENVDDLDQNNSEAGFVDLSLRRFPQENFTVVGLRNCGLATAFSQASSTPIVICKIKALVLWILKSGLLLNILLIGMMLSGKY
jgi:hypothetical protein